MRIRSLLLPAFLAVASFGALSACDEAAQVAHDELGPKALLKKYEWFKDVAAQLDKKKADIQVYASRMKALDDTYKGVSRLKWPREDREQYNLWTSEVAGVKAGYNSLAAEYNAQVKKVNWKFMNVDGLPDSFADYETH